jgi:hypothetical protein
VTLTLALVDTGSRLTTGLAWLYVGLRIAHSLVHAIINVIILRFALFMAASLVLLALTIRAALATIGFQRRIHANMFARLPGASARTRLL